MMLKNLLRRDTKGIGAVEFALVAPVLISFVIGISQVGKLFYASADMKNALASGARVASVYPVPGPDAVIAAVKDRIARTGGVGDTFDGGVMRIQALQNEIHVSLFQKEILHAASERIVAFTCATRAARSGMLAVMRNLSWPCNLIWRFFWISSMMLVLIGLSTLKLR